MLALEDARKLRQVQKDAGDYANLVADHLCPKCGKGTSPSVAYHPNKAWYQWNSCKLGIKKEHLHYVCNVCQAHYGRITSKDDEILFN
jgi:Zn finger protein HypA/HybF involved in hydrogenase expression